MLSARAMGSSVINKKVKRIALKYFVPLVAAVLVISSILVGQRTPYYPDCFLKSLGGPLVYDDPAVLQYIKREILVPPSSSPYNLTDHFFIKNDPLRSVQFYKRYLLEIFNETRNGFFVEAGALDGQTMSNTLWLEKYRGWTGLLVEPDPSNFRLLLQKNRKSWAVNVCLSVEKYPKLERFSSSDIVSDAEYKDVRVRSMGSILRDAGKNLGLTSDDLYNSYYKRQCFPLGSLLLAMNVTRVDLLSLDVEFFEERVLQNFDFKRFDVQVLFTEYHDDNRIQQFHKYLESQGFVFVANQLGDMIYCKNMTNLLARISKIHPVRTLHLFT